LGSFFSRSF